MIMSNLYTFKSGLRLVCKTMSALRSVSMSVYTAVGSVNEDASNNGISHFIEHMMFKGTDKLNAEDISKAFDNVGARVNAFTSKQATCYYFTAMDEHVDKCAELLSSLMFKSTFDKEELEREKKVVLEEISMSEDENDDLCIENLTNLFFSGHELGKTIIGQRENVKSFTREQLIDYIGMNYRASTTVISIAGNISFEEAKALVEKYFEGRFAEGEREWQDKPCKGNTGYVEKIRDISQANIAFGFPSFGITDKNYPALMLINALLGGGMSSRLYLEIREKLGLAYNVYTFNASYAHNGMFCIYIGTNPESVNKCVEVIKNELVKLLNDGFTEEEFARGKEQLKSAYVFGQEIGSSIMNAQSKELIFNNKLLDLDDKINTINGLTLDYVNDVCKEIFNLSKVCASYVGKKYKGNIYEEIKI